jgi:hypothetical protein
MNKEQERKLKIGPFIPENSDGCTVLSWVYIKLTGKKLPFRQCCVDHDEDYWYGGSRRMRRESDARLRRCVFNHNNGTVLGKLFYGLLSWGMWAAVRIGGSPKLPTPWRWKFSQPYTTRNVFGGYESEEQ